MPEGDTVWRTAQRLNQVFAVHRAIVGRSAGCDLRLSDPTVSAFHAELSAAQKNRLSHRTRAVAAMW